MLPDSNIFHNLKAGIRWKFTSYPKLSWQPIPFTTNEDQLPLLKQAAQKLVDKGAVEILSQEEQSTPGYYSNLFLRPKPSGEYRPIIDLSLLNKHIHCPTFKMETVQSIRQSLQPGEWCTQIDIQDAYLHIPVQQKFRKYLRFSVGGTVYQFKTLPFGLNVAPRIFTQVLKPVLGHLRSLGIKVHGYLDDWLVRALSPKQAEEHTNTVLELLRRLGWLVNWDKCNLVPSQVFTFLGLTFDTKAALVRPGQKGLDSLCEMVKAIRVGQFYTARHLSSLIGKAKHWAPYTRRGKLHLRKTQEWLKRRWNQSRWNWEQLLQADSRLTKQLRWWTLPGNTSLGVRLHTPAPSQDMFTDACPTGWGARLNSLTARGTWEPRSAQLHINRLELRAVHLACQQFQESLRGKVTRVFIDNTTAVAYIKKQGGTKSCALTQDARKLLQWCDSQDIILVPVHIAGVKNVEADRLSRAGQILSTEWSLSDAEFLTVRRHWGTPDLDLFATAQNRRVRNFCSPVPHPEAWAVDALAQDWPGDLLLYAYPPTPLVPLILQKVRQSRVPLQLILVTSAASTKPWHADLKALATGEPLPIARTSRTLWQIPVGETDRQFHSRPDLYNLGAWKINFRPQ